MKLVVLLSLWAALFAGAVIAQEGCPSTHYPCGSQSCCPR